MLSENLCANNRFSLSFGDNLPNIETNAMWAFDIIAICKNYTNRLLHNYNMFEPIQQGCYIITTGVPLGEMALESPNLGPVPLNNMNGNYEPIVVPTFEASGSYEFVVIPTYDCGNPPSSTPTPPNRPSTPR